MSDLSGLTPAGMRAARIAAGLSLRATAKRMSVSAPYLSDLERGHRQITNKAYAAFWQALAGEATAPAPDPAGPLRRELREAHEIIHAYHQIGVDSLAGFGDRTKVSAWLARNAAFGAEGGAGE